MPMRSKLGANDSTDSALHSQLPRGALTPPSSGAADDDDGSYAPPLLR